MKYTILDTEKLVGYKKMTPFYELFSIYDQAGSESIETAYSILFDFYKGDYKILTELAMILNWKIWEHYETNLELAKTYERLWINLDGYIMNNFTEKEMKYYLKATDL